MANTREIPEVFNFEGQHFKMWQMKMEYLLKVLKVLYMLNTDCPRPFGYRPAVPIRMINGF